MSLLDWLRPRPVLRLSRSRWESTDQRPSIIDELLTQVPSSRRWLYPYPGLVLSHDGAQLALHDEETGSEDRIRRLLAEHRIRLEVTT